MIATGSTLARTRLYRIAITKKLTVIEKFFEIFGLKDNNWCKFEVDTHYEVFLVIRKISIMKTEEISKKVPKGFIINKDLDKYAGTVLFPEKLEKVTNLVKNVSPPKSQNKD